jgi:hypothetical protein
MAWNLILEFGSNFGQSARAELLGKWSFRAPSLRIGLEIPFRSSLRSSSCSSRSWDSGGRDRWSSPPHFSLPIPALPHPRALSFPSKSLTLERRSIWRRRLVWRTSPSKRTGQTCSAVPRLLLLPSPPSQPPGTKSTCMRRMRCCSPSIRRGFVR